MLEDQELRDIFKIASEDHLQKLEEGLLYLEKTPDDQAKLEELLREAHSLKGDAGMLGIKDIATLAHQMEHILGAIKRGETQFTSVVSDRLYQGLDAIRQLVKEAVTGETPAVNAFYVLAYMMGAENTASQTAPENQPQESKETVNEENIQPEEKFHTTESPRSIDIVPLEIQPLSPSKDTTDVPVLEAVTTQVEEPQNIASPLEPLNPSTPQFLTSSPAQPLAPASSRFAIESVRVETRHLDSLMTQAGELTVTKTRIAHRLIQIEEIVNLCEEWSRENSINRFLSEEMMPRVGAFKSSDKNHDLSLQISEQNHGNGFHQWQIIQSRIQERLELVNLLVNRLRNAIYEDNARLEIVADELSDGIRTLRLLPLSTIFNLFPRMVRDLSKQENKQVNLIIEGGETKADKRIIEEMKDPLMHMIRNCVDHGIETPEERQKIGKYPQAKIEIKAKQTATNVIIEVRDDGRGLDIQRIKQTALKRGICREEELANMTPNQIQYLIFEPGFSTRTFVTEVSGRGVGLDVVRTNVELLKGTVQVDSEPGKGCTIRLQLPTTLATAHVLIVAVMEMNYAIPVEFVQMARFVSPDEIFTIEGRDTIVLDNQPISVTQLADLLELSPANTYSSLINSNSNDRGISTTKHIPCIILKVGDERLGLLVDDLVDEQDVMLKPQSQLLKRIRNVAGATILGNGEVCMVLNPQDLIKSVRKRNVSIIPKSIPQAANHKQVILLVEDSISTRTQEKRILESAGYEVVTAVDGVDGFNKLKSRSFDAVVSDVQMPNMDGLSLTSKIRQHKEYSEIPIILVTSLASEEDKKRGAEAGANAYITKGNFNQEVLLDTLRRLV